MCYRTGAVYPGSIRWHPSEALESDTDVRVWVASTSYEYELVQMRSPGSEKSWEFNSQLVSVCVPRNARIIIHSSPVGKQLGPGFDQP